MYFSPSYWFNHRDKLLGLSIKSAKYGIHMKLLVPWLPMISFIRLAQIQTVTLVQYSVAFSRPAVSTSGFHMAFVKSKDHRTDLKNYAFLICSVFLISVSWFLPRDILIQLLYYICLASALLQPCMLLQRTMLCEALWNLLEGGD